MPLILSVLNVLSRIGIQLGVFALIDRVVVPYINKAVEEAMIFFGTDQEVAIDIVANEYVRLAETIGLSVLALRAKTTKGITEKLQFDKKGWEKRAIPSTAMERLKMWNLAPVASTLNQASRLDQARSWATIALAAFGLPISVGILAVNTIDFAAWPTSAYQTTVQSFLSFFGLEPDKDARDPRTVGEEVFNKIYGALSLSGTKFLNDIYKGQAVAFTRDNLLDLVDKIGSDILTAGGTANTKAVMSFLLILSSLKPEDINKITGEEVFTSTLLPKTAKTKIFTGVLSQGVLGAKIDFVNRPNGLITSLQELGESAANNLAPWLTTLLGRLIYEVKLVSSVQAKDGTTSFSTTQQVLSSYTTLGQPRYKTIINRFAVLNLFILTEKNIRVKLRTITLGPTDAVKLQPSLAELQKLNATLASTITTTDIGEVVKTITPREKIAPTPTAVALPPVFAPAPTPVFTPGPVSAPAPAPTPAPARNTGVVLGKVCGTHTLWEFYTTRDGFFPSFSFRAAEYEEIGLGKASEYFATEKQNAEHLAALKKLYGCGREAPAPVFAPAPAPVFAPAPAPVFAPAPTPTPVFTRACAADTLSDFYTAKNLPIPSIEVRGTIAEGLGLIPKGLYIGTAEQNTILLRKLQSLDGCG